MNDTNLINIENIFMMNLENISLIEPTELGNRIKNVYSLCVKIPSYYSHIAYAFVDLYYTQLKKYNCIMSEKTKQTLDDLIRQVRLVNKYSKLVEIMIDNRY
jgi:hypothetical protein